MKISSSATIDLKEINSLIRRMSSLESHEAQYGYFAGDIHQSSGLDVAVLVNTLQEDRPFMDYAGDMMERHFEASNLWKKEVWCYLAGRGSIIQLLKQFGRIGETYVQASIDTGDWLPNAEWWREAKIALYGSTAPLIETNEMYESVSTRIIKTKE